MLGAYPEVYLKTHPTPEWSKSIKAFMFINLKSPSRLACVVDVLHTLGIGCNVSGRALSLKHRPDRRTAILSQFQKLGVPCEKVIRIDAVQHSHPIRGCTYSHRNAISYALIHNLERVMICEDDFTVLDVSKFHDAMNSLDSLEFGMCMVGMTPVRLTTHTSHISYIQRALGLGSYVIQSVYYPKMLKILKEAIDKKQPHDLITQFYQESDKWIGFFPAIARQAPGFSDIENRFTDYAYLEVEAQMLQGSHVV